jgi:hypothetical protein
MQTHNRMDVKPNVKKWGPINQISSSGSNLTTDFFYNESAFKKFDSDTSDVRVSVFFFALDVFYQSVDTYILHMYVF